MRLSSWEKSPQGSRKQMPLAAEYVKVFEEHRMEIVGSILTF
jgi:hypothetical protein